MIRIDGITNLALILNKLKPKNIFLLTGKTSYSLSQAQDKIEEQLSKQSYFRFFDFNENPDYEDVIKGVSLFKADNFDLIISVGGGSVIDMGKLINWFQVHENYRDPSIITNSSQKKGANFIAIPTTAGSGSEATKFAVLYYKKKKYSICSNYILPDYSIIEPSFTYSLSPYQTAVTGLDALSQAIESCWSINSTDESKTFAHKAIHILWHELQKAVDKNDIFSRNLLMDASHLSGKAINITKTTGPHALSYPFTTYFNLPHGHAVALTLAQFLKFNYNVTAEDCNDKRGTNFIRSSIKELIQVLHYHDIDDFCNALDKYILNLGIDISRDKFNFENDANLNLILNSINLDRLSNNPRRLDHSSLVRIIKKS